MEHYGTFAPLAWNILEHSPSRRWEKMRAVRRWKIMGETPMLQKSPQPSQPRAHACIKRDRFLDNHGHRAYHFLSFRSFTAAEGLADAEQIFASGLSD
jgi:hypothetical protein